MLALVLTLLLCGSSYAGSYSTIMGYYKPSIGEINYGAAASANFQLIDEAVPGFKATVPSGAVVGDFVYISGSGTCALSRADNAATAKVHGIVFYKINATTARIRTSGRIEGLTGLSAGSIYYLSAVNEGEMTAVAPSTPNKRVMVGVALSTTEFVLTTAMTEAAAGVAAAAFQDTYDADTSAAAFDLDGGGSFAVRDSSSADILKVDEGGDVILTSLLGPSTANLTIWSGTGRDLNLGTADGATAMYIPSGGIGGIHINDPIQSTDTTVNSVTFRIGNDGDSGFGTADNAKEAALYYDNVNRFWVEATQFVVASSWPLSVGHSPGSPDAEDGDGKVYFGGIAGHKSLSLQANEADGGDTIGRDSFFFYGPGDPDNPSSIPMASITTADGGTVSAGVFDLDTHLGFAGDAGPENFTLAVDEYSGIDALILKGPGDPDNPSSVDISTLTTFVVLNHVPHAFEESVDVQKKLYISTLADETIDGSGNVVYSGVRLRVDTAAAGPTDDLDTMSGQANGAIVIIRPVSTARTVVIRHNIGAQGFLLRNGVSFSMDDAADYWIGYYDSSVSRWAELGRHEAQPGYYEVTGTVTDTQNGAAYAQIDDMTVTPEAGVYLASFSASASSATAPDALFAIYSDGSIVQHSERGLKWTGAGGEVIPVHCQAVITVDGDDVVTAQIDANSVSTDIYERSLVLTRLN